MPSSSSQKTRKNKTKRQVICQDAIVWLADKKGMFDSIVTSIPDESEVGLGMEEYEPFFKNAAKLCLNAVKPDGYCIFLQTDRKYRGIFPKDYYVMHEAFQLGFRLVWHKIALRTDPGKADLFRPTYSHMLCFSKNSGPGKSTPDVLYRGPTTYGNAFGKDAVISVISFLKTMKIRTVVDPFVGSGTTLAIANHLGMSAVGVDIDPKQCEKAKKLTFDSI